MEKIVNQFSAREQMIKIEWKLEKEFMRESKW